MARVGRIVQSDLAVLGTKITISNMKDARSKLAFLVARVAAGQSRADSTDGKSIDELMPLNKAGASPVSRIQKGQFKVPDDFDRMMEDEIADMFNNTPLKGQ